MSNKVKAERQGDRVVITKVTKKAPKTTDEKLDAILADLALIKKALNLDD